MTYLEIVKKLLGLDESHYPQMEIEKLPGLVSESKEGIIEGLIMSQCPGYYLGRGKAPFKRLWDNNISTGENKDSKSTNESNIITGCEYENCWGCWNSERVSYLDYIVDIMTLKMWGLYTEEFLEKREDGDSYKYREKMVNMLKELVSNNLCVRDFYVVDMRHKKCRNGVELLHKGNTECTECWKETKGLSDYISTEGVDSEGDYNYKYLNTDFRIRPSLLTPATQNTSDQKVMDKMLEEVSNWTNEHTYKGTTTPKDKTYLKGTTGYVENPPTIESTGGYKMSNNTEKSATGNRLMLLGYEDDAGKMVKITLSPYMAASIVINAIENIHFQIKSYTDEDFETLTDVEVMNCLTEDPEGYLVSIQTAHRVLSIGEKVPGIFPVGFNLGEYLAEVQYFGDLLDNYIEIRNL